MTGAMANDLVDDEEHEHEDEDEPIFEDREKLKKERRTTIATLASIAVVVVVAAIVQHQQRSSVAHRRLINDRDDRVGNLDSVTRNMFGPSTKQDDTIREVFVDNLSGHIDEYGDENQEIIFGLTVKDLKETRRVQEERKNGRRARGSSRKSGSGKSSENVILLDGGPAFAEGSVKSNSQKDSSSSPVSTTNNLISSKKSGKRNGEGKSSKESLSPNVSLEPSTEPSMTPQPSSSSRKGKAKAKAKGKGKRKDNGKKSKKGKSSVLVSETLLGLGLPLGGITDFTSNSEDEFNTLTKDFVTNFVENEFGNTVRDFETTITVTDFIPAGRRLDERSRSLMPADSVVVYDQQLTYETTDPTLTSLELAVAPFETQESRDEYVEDLNSSDDENLQMVTSASRVIIPSLSSAPSPIDDSVAPTIEPSITSSPSSANDSSAPSPSNLSLAPTVDPSISLVPSTADASGAPSVSDNPTGQDTSRAPSVSNAPSVFDASSISNNPTSQDESRAPSVSAAPSATDASLVPTVGPSSSGAPSASPSASPTGAPSASPSASPTATPLSQNVPFEQCYVDLGLGVICNSVSCVDQGAGFEDPQACANRCFAATKPLAALGLGENCKCCDECITCSGPPGSVYAVNNAPCEPLG